MHILVHTLLESIVRPEVHKYFMQAVVQRRLIAVAITHMRHRRSQFLQTVAVVDRNGATGTEHRRPTGIYFVIAARYRHALRAPCPLQWMRCIIVSFIIHVKVQLLLLAKYERLSLSQYILLYG